MPIAGYEVLAVVVCLQVVRTRLRLRQTLRTFVPHLHALCFRATQNAYAFLAYFTG